MLISVAKVFLCGSGARAVSSVMATNDIDICTMSIFNPDRVKRDLSQFEIIFGKSNRVYVF